MSLIRQVPDEQLCERAIDQLVDEVLDRLTALEAILPHDLEETPLLRRSSDARVRARAPSGPPAARTPVPQRHRECRRRRAVVTHPTAPTDVVAHPLGQLLANSLRDDA